MENNELYRELNRSFFDSSKKELEKLLACLQVTYDHYCKSYLFFLSLTLIFTIISNCIGFRDGDYYALVLMSCLAFYPLIKFRRAINLLREDLTDV